MQTWIALFRGINVGGNNKLPMAKLKTGLESLKLTNVQNLYSKRQCSVSIDYQVKHDACQEDR